MPVGIAPDSAIEAVKLPGAAWVVGVQWHPKEGEDPRLFEALVEQARSSRTRRGSSTSVNVDLAP